MKFPLLVTSFGYPKLILEIGGNAVGFSEQQTRPRQHRRRGTYASAEATVNHPPREDGGSSTAQRR
ncbi:MAG: hypothetical protein WDZ30_12560 [Cellvibrionaceae bacterium]